LDSLVLEGSSSSSELPADQSAAMQGVQLAVAVFILSLATFIVILDATIINVAVPHIAGTFAASPNEATWVITAYAVAEALTVPLTGWLVARFGIIRTLITSISCFAIFSVFCGIAPNLQSLVALRVLQGLSGGPLIPISQTLILRISPPKRAEMVMGLWMMTSIIAPIAGPILGGTLADTLGWRWAFYLNVPVVAICAGCSIWIFRKFESRQIRERIDLVGLALLVIWVGCLQVMLDMGEDQDWFSSTEIRAFLGISLLGFLAFVIWELTDDFPVVDLKIFRHRAFTVSAAAMFLAFGAFFASLVLLPLWLQLGMGYTATLSGYVLAYQGALGVIAAPITAALMPRVDARILMSSGLMILSGAIFCRSGFATTIGFNQMILPQLAMGIGLPLFFVPLMTLSLKAVQKNEMASASGVINFLRTIAAAIATSIVVATWNDQSIVAHARLASVLRAPDASLSRLESAGLSGGQAVQALDITIWHQAMVLAANNIAIGLSVIIALTAIGIWTMPKIEA
jgi:DHA2 family multidrug resistance protein